MTLRVELDVDCYGGDARKSALADLIELQAMRHPAMTEAQLADYAADVGWGRRWASKFVDVGEDSDSEGPTARDLAIGAFEAIGERTDFLREMYPFRMNSHGSLIRKAEQLGIYDTLLAISASHVHGLAIGVNPRDYLEEVVVRSMSCLGLRTAAVAVHRRQGHRFEDSLRLACQQVGLQAIPTGASRRRRAFDGGVDVLAHLPILPRRNSVWTAIGQVTCARSDEWERKFAEPKAKTWNGLLGGDLFPVPFLALPYHVTSLEFRHLEQAPGTHGGLLIDRLSITQALHGTPLTTTDLHAAAALATIEIDGPRGIAEEAVKVSA